MLTAGIADRHGEAIRGGIAPASQARMIVAALEGALMMERLLDGATGFADSVAAIEFGLIRPIARR